MSDEVARVTAAILVEDGAVLLAPPPSGDRLACHRELPGSRFDVGRSPDERLTRELAEECTIEAVAGRESAECTHRYPHATIHVLAFWVDDWSGEPVLPAHDDHRRVSLSDVAPLCGLRAEVQR